ncbi:glycerate kinase [Compostimonas suwonensis]|uniref:Glycerate kinase n=1 Tax=Compostimonas suwonensis TaxID=1048394 RepID=A0A2M9BCH9_9MICO|nr:glycerate kinase [Compostimonas suwonensis]PJJ55667.1 glycerate kinase [Compostimonas suwonensis]
MSRIVIAPDSFKGSASAVVVARAIAEGWRSVRPHDEIVLLPMADGGEGTLDAFELAVPGACRMPVTVDGPGRTNAPDADADAVDAAWLLLPDGTGVVELAATSGITLFGELAPFDAHTSGFGQAIRAALDHGVRRLLLAVGGSASSDGGAGALSALGVRLLDQNGRPLARGNRGLESLAAVDLTALAALPAGGAIVLSDVTNPLLGPAGAAAVFGPQKGADAAAVARLEANLVRLAGLLAGVDPSTPGAGAAGGTAFGLLVWGAELASGAQAVAEVVGLADAVRGADLVITGEGRFDEQSAAGKVVSQIAAVAGATDAGSAAAGVATSVALVAGLIEAPVDGFAASVSLTELAGSSAAAMAHTERWLREAGAVLASTALAAD